MKRTLQTCAAAVLALAGITVAAACRQAVVEPDALSFVSTQAGAPLEGTFKQFSAEICLDGDGQDRIEVRVNIDSIDTMLPELDEILKGADFLDSAQWPQAVFVSDKVQALGENHYKVTGKLTLRDVTRAIEVPFNLKPGKNGSPPRLEGSTTIKRLDYGIGQGEWRDTKWVADDVTIKFSVTLKD